MTLDSYHSVLAALCVWREARNQSIEARRGVLHVILNRVRDPRWPDDAAGVVLQPLQFSSFNRDDPNAALMPKPGDKQFGECCELVDNPGDDPTSGANHYHSLMPKYPAWANRSAFTGSIGEFRFYRL